MACHGHDMTQSRVRLGFGKGKFEGRMDAGERRTKMNEYAVRLGAVRLGEVRTRRHIDVGGLDHGSF